MKLKNIKCLLAVCLCASALLVGCGQKTADKSETSSESAQNQSEDIQEASRDVFAMDTYMTVTAYGENAEAAVDAAQAEIERLDELLSTGNADSEIAKLNTDGSAELSEDAGYLTERALELKPEEMEKNNIRFQTKYKQIEENEVRFEEIHCDDADYLIVAFGSMARIGQKAMELAREEGIKVGMLRPITLWPFPTKAIAAYADKVKGMLVTELNAGQMVEDVRLAVNGKVKVEHFGRLGGIVPDPDEIVDALKEKLIKK